LANSFDEALSGAIKLARYSADIEGRPKTGLVLDPEGRIGPSVSVAIDGMGKIDFLPDLVVAGSEGDDAAGMLREAGRFGFVVVFPSSRQRLIPDVAALTRADGKHSLPIIICVDRASLAYCRAEPSTAWRTLRPAIVVFDESFVHGHVPFGAFTARESLYDYWNRRGNATFHSTTYQPNAVSTLHFLRCLKQDDPEMFARLASQLERVAIDPAYCKFLLARLYSPSLARAATALGWDRQLVRAAGHYVTANGRQVFDAIAGVACSVRGHNPPGYSEEIEQLGDGRDFRQAATERLRNLTGLGNLLPGVSGASAVENALRIALAAQFPRTYVLALRGGFGGKTLLALTGTANEFYRRHLGPLYPEVLYVDPFGERAVEDLEAACRTYPIGVVQAELVQAVGGVRPVPEKVLRYLEEGKRRWGYLLFVDEVQTGMYRTGPFIRSREVGVEPDLLTIGKGTSDMMFPFAVTLYSDRVEERLESRKTKLPEALRKRFDYEFGYKTLLNVLDRANDPNLPDRVREMGALFTDRLACGLDSCSAVREVRVFGLLIAIELEMRRRPRKWLRKQAGPLYILNMLRHEPFPVLAGYCQYEPHVLKLTPPLTITREEVGRVSETMAAVLKRPVHALLPSVVAGLAKSIVKGKWEAYRHGRANRECLER
jgi:acetylornithine/succinyldiaminopimelate/putrescine aminotransferase